jgi:hypothetical protein
VFLRFAHYRRIRAWLPAWLLLLIPLAALAGGPKYVAGVSFFNPSVVGQPVHWANGQVNYYVDQGPLNSAVTNQQAKAMVDAAAALWSAVPTAGVTLTDKGALLEDVSGANLVVSGTNFTVANEQLSQLGVITQPTDVTPSATGTPLGILFDADGTVIDALFGTGVAEQNSCQNNGVYVWLDNINPNGSIAHGIIVLNGLCATNANLLDMMSFQLERAFGRVLGLDYAQVNLGAQFNGELNGTLGWPVMQPVNGFCGSSGGDCIPDPTVLRWDDIAALNRIYPITTANLASFPGKQITASHTISLQGTISFRDGVGMQGVNVVARPLDTNGNPLYQYSVSFVSGAYFNGNHGNPVTGTTDTNGNPLTMWGSNQTAQQGFFDLSGIPLPPSVTTANYELTFEAVDPDYILNNSVGPYLQGTPEPSGTLAAIIVSNLAAGSTQTFIVTPTNSAVSDSRDAIGSEAVPRLLAASGMWSGRLSQIGQTDWLRFPVRAGRTFSVVAVALDEKGAPTNLKALPALGVWDASDPMGSSPVSFGAGLSGLAVGESWLQVTASVDDIVRLGIADERGDGRPDYAYQGWVLYADTVQPLRLPTTGGAIVIHGMGFRPSDTVQVGGLQALITSISPNEITAIAPAAANDVTGSVDVEVDDLPVYNASALIAGGISYNSATNDALTMLSAPMGSVPIGVPQPFSVTALGSDMTPAGGVSVTYTVTSGTATLGCGQSACTVTATGDGRATMNVTATSSGWATVIASLTSGSSIKSEFYGTTPPTISSLSPMLSLAAGASLNWTTQSLVLRSGVPASGLAVTWQTTSGGILLPSGSVTTNANGIAAKTVTIGPLIEGQIVTANACLNGSSPCVTFTAFGARPEYATLEAVSGVAQSITAQATASQITLRVLYVDGNPMAGGTVTLHEALYAWAPPCPPHGRCAQPELLASQVVNATSALDGTVIFTPASIPGVATNLLAQAVTGNTGSVTITVEQHP